jgi:phage regulator Rha-like protein
MLNILSTQTNATEAGLTMTSREIAELTGKQHKDVLYDIRKMLDDLGKTSADFSADLPDTYGRLQPCFRLPKRETLILVSGYSTELRARIIDRWQELEATVAQPAPLAIPSASATEALAVAEMMSRYLNIQGPSRLALFEKALSIKAPEYLPMLPAYGVNAPRTSDGKLLGAEVNSKAAYAATALLRKFGSSLSIHQFNRLVEVHGFLEVRERPSTAHAGVMRTYKAVSEAGLRYGYNLSPKDRPQNVQPIWFEETFSELLGVIS